jgi:hypothetical protein
MHLKIKKVIIWPKNDELQPREIQLKTDSINVVVGDSKTGKSSIISIIDYCLGSSKCLIPVGPIRDYSQWFGILIEINSGEVLLARKEPGLQSSTDLMYIEEGKNISIPTIIEESNINRNTIVNKLSAIDGLPRSNFSTEETVKPQDEKPSFRDFLSFCFQPQHIIANPFTLFYKADTIEHKLKLKNIIPLSIGIITSEVLEAEKRIQRLEQLIREKNNVLAEKRKIKAAWDLEIKSNYLSAFEFGILSTRAPIVNIESLSSEDCIFYLREACTNINLKTDILIENGLADKVQKYIISLRKKEEKLLERLDFLKIKSRQYDEFYQISINYKRSVNSQIGRLEPTGWLAKKMEAKGKHNCPICDSENITAKENVEALVNSINSLNSKISHIDNSMGLVDKEINEINNEILEVENQCNNVRVEIYKLSRENSQIENRLKSIENTYRLVGKIEENIKNYDQVSAGSDLILEIQKLKEEVDAIKKAIDYNGKDERKKYAISSISNLMKKYNKILDIEKYENPTELDLSNLTLNIFSGNRKDYLWEIGSGSNWMGYHISCILAMHEFFLKLKYNYVPSFIVFDQPSQVYFPETIRDDEGKQLNSDDIVRVKYIFNALSEYMSTTKNVTQIILLEHAAKEIWSEIPNTYFVEGERWKSDHALIPNEWFE